MLQHKTTALLRIACEIMKGNKIHPATIIIEQKNLTLGKNISIKPCVLNLKNGQLKIGNNSWLNHGLEIDSLHQISIGERTSIQKRTTINGSVVIGNDCIIAPNVFISSGTHIFDLLPEKTIREQEEYAAQHQLDVHYNKPVSIGNDVWIGVNAVIMPGITIGNGCIVGANAVVTKDVSSGQIVAGVPAKVIGHRKLDKK